MKARLVFFVRDHNASRDFYRSIFQKEPVLSVAGMTEFDLGSELVLGLMPETGMAQILGDRIFDPALAQGVPKAELYLVQPDANEMYDRAIGAGAKSISPMQMRGCGQTVAYVMDTDGYVLAFELSTPHFSNNKGPIRMQSFAMVSYVLLAFLLIAASNFFNIQLLLWGALVCLWYVFIRCVKDYLR